jgi:hypothetical protein
MSLTAGSSRTWWWRRSVSTGSSTGHEIDRRASFSPGGAPWTRSAPSGSVEIGGLSDGPWRGGVRLRRQDGLTETGIEVKPRRIMFAERVAGPVGSMTEVPGA